MGEKKTTSDKLWKLKWFSVISSVHRWHSSLCWTAALTVTTYNLLWCLRFELFEVTMKVQLWSSGLETASRWGNKDTFEPLERHDFNSLEAGRVEESPGQDPRSLICARTFTNRSSLSFVIREWKTCLIGSKVRRQSQKIWWSYGDLRDGFWATLPLSCEATPNQCYHLIKLLLSGATSSPSSNVSITSPG